MRLHSSIVKSFAVANRDEIPFYQRRAFSEETDVCFLRAKLRRMGKLFCGTSGFAYASWKPDFYPPKLPAKDFLKHYATRLNSVEANYTFRRLPAPTTLESWVNCTPGEFVFAPKAHQRITHIQRLKPSEFTDVFFRAIDPLRTTGRLGPVLVQLPPNLKCDVDLLEGFLATVPEDIRYAFEFRNTTWLKDEVYRVLEKRGAALCLAESEKLVIPEVVTAPPSELVAGLSPISKSSTTRRCGAWYAQ